VSEVDYKWPRPGSDTPVQKISFVTRIGDQVCAVGYYK
jgi:signal transduction histidine kinase